MKALVCHQFGPIDNLQLQELPSPTPSAGQVVVKVMAASVNFPDVLIVQGLYQMRPEPPFSPGAELAGEIIKVGEQVTDWQVGDKVIASCGYGAFAKSVWSMQIS